MRRAIVGTLGLTLTAGFLVALGSTAQAQPDDGHTPPTTKPQSAVSDNLPDPLADKRSELRKSALSDVLAGRRDAIRKNGSTVVKVGTKAAPTTKIERQRAKAGKSVKQREVDQYVELSREKTDKIFVVLAEFGDQRHPSYPDQDTDPATQGPATFDGPLHNAIPEPDRSKDNSTVWQADYSADYYRNLYFGEDGESLKTYYEKQSSGRYSVDGEVTDWVKVPYNEARYGRSNGFPCTGNVCSNTWYLLQDGINTWVAQRKAAGQTDAQIKAELADFDVWDRDDQDGDGNFNEPDGYIDHFQIVHSGGDQADGDPQQGEDAIWSHRWRAFQNTTSGPDGYKKIGGTQIGNTGLWVADYTIQPENGGLSVFAHEYGHDLGLPDLYDTESNADSPVAWWSLMAQSRLSAKGDAGIGERPGDLGAWEKLQLGWFDYETAAAGDKRTLKLGPHEYNSKNAQGLVVVLPKKQVVTDLPDPVEGDRTWYSGTGNDLDASMARSLTLPAGTASLSFQAAYNIEDCEEDPCDYAYVEVNDGDGWAAIPGSIANPAEGNGIDGVSGPEADPWVPATFDLSAYAGETISLRVRYFTDGAAAGNDDSELPPGIFVDAITVTANGATLFADGAETSPNGWDLDGFTSVATSVTTLHDNYYIASNRTYTSFDKYLKTGPYNFGWATTRPDWVEHFPYQDGLLISYWDTSYADNNIGVHPGGGEILPIDANPRALVRLDGGGAVWRNRVQMYDATFGLQKSDSITLHNNGQANYIRGQAGQPLFDDTKSYQDVKTPTSSVKVANAGVTLRVLEQQGTTVKVRLGTSAGGLRSVTTR